MRTYKHNYNSKKLADAYLEHATKIAMLHQQLIQIKERFDYLGEVAEDNRDPFIQMENACSAVGEALSTAMNYYQEYKEEAEGKEDTPSAE